MKELLQKFENKRPEIVFEWKDSETEAEGWVVINSLRGGAAGGGTRMRKGLDKREVESLAKTMEVKFTVSGPPIGGAKSGINFDPNDPRKAGVLQRWYASVMPLLKYYYGTGGDLNVDEIHEVIPITEDVGIWHPQEGVFTGHYKPTEAQKVNRIGQLRQGVVKVIEDEQFTPSLQKKYTVADMCTGYGVAQAVKHYYELWGGNVAGKRAVVQGWGNVGAAAGFYLAQMGVKVVGILTHEGGLINQDGFTLEEIRQLVTDRNGNRLVSPDLLPFDVANTRIWDLAFEIFIPAAASRLITREQVDRMMASHLEVFSCGANVPFADPEIFFGPTGLYADQKFSVLPDFIANCGMARVFAFFMESEVKMEDAAIFQDIAQTIRKALDRTYAVNKGKTGIAQASFELSLKQLVSA
ncbi:Glu/Leu/Phe/Val dehydrogenase dimerization domain-containing protein [Parachryseolinea silvisoli]|jgi:glutamate dehydrogenase/leucine dehydrogenase|uniref:Glu/Leu/Phe/Val dehydrogenase dimerization domain-containing protein n=1 Tax=Parachryseolinea silvisoli TaxID=2873601 RepID=UPI0022658196|nr:Glu/Leu/Phe/Val dehydrogenase dimerization domain-containing protein [Parachryseolinea silvisoli]MCD9016968.1 amino acid dehydrogenase [Parachryseolinea silvisoli]